MPIIWPHELPGLIAILEERLRTNLIDIRAIRHCILHEWNNLAAYDLLARYLEARERMLCALELFEWRKFITLLPS